MPNFKISNHHYFLFLFILGFCQSSFSQIKRSFYKFDSKDGINASHIYDIVQDSKGFLWIGTSTGLLKYDGQSFQNINIPSLKNAEVIELEIDEDDNLWFLNLSSQLCKFSPDHSVNIINFDENISIYDIWLEGDQVGIFRSSAFRAIMNRHTLEVDDRTKSGFIFPCFNDKIYLFDDQKGQKYIQKGNKKYPVKIENKSIDKSDVFFKLGSEYYFIGSNSKYLLRMYEDNNSYIVEPIPNLVAGATINSVSLPNDSTLHLNTSLGVYEFINSIERNTQIYAEGINTTNSLIDHENNLWITLMNNGLLFSHYSNINTIENLHDFSITDIIETDSSLWFGTNQGNTITIKEDGVHIQENIKNDKVRYIVKQENQILIGQNNSISKYKNGEYVNTLSYPNCQKDAIAYDTNKLFISTCGGFVTYEFNENNTQTLIDSFVMNRILAIHHDDKDQIIWFSTLNGINKFDLIKHQIEYDVIPHLKDYNIIDIELADDNTFWLATNNAGVIGLRNQEIFKHLNTENLLNSNYINEIFIDEAENLWICTPSGINFINSTLSTVKHITSKDGLNSDIVQNVYVSNGTVYVGTVNGINVFDANVSFSNSTRPPIYISETLIDGIPNNLKDLSGTEENFRFNFHGINYSSLGNFNYKYRLKGLSNNWQNIPGKISEVIYNKLPPGDYTFEVIAINEDGVESLNPATISFHLPKPLYSKWWFILTCTLLIFFCTLLLFLRRINHINKRNELELNVRAQQLIALKAQMKPHFISNVLNSIQSHSMLQDPLMVNQYITRLSKFVRKVLNMSDAQVVYLQDEIDVLQTYIELEQLRSDKSFAYKISIDPNVDQEKFQLPPMLLQPYIENAIKHGISGIEDGLISIDIMKGKTDSIMVSIQDNGPGIDSLNHSQKNNNHISLGSKKNSDRINLLQEIYKKTFSVNVKDLTESSSPNQGTNVVLEISDITNQTNE